MTTVDIPIGELQSLGAPVHYPTASSRLLLDLLRLSRTADAGPTNDSSSEQLQGVIARPVLRSLLAALRLRDANTIQHVRRTALIATGLARFLGWDGRPLRKLEIAALLHDIGKIGVPDHVLFKPGPLNPAEQELFALQHHVGIDVLQACRVDQEVLDIVNQSNPNYDSNALNNAELNLGARILAIADAYDSLSHNQVYRDAKPHEDILAILSGTVDTRFDGNLVNALNRWIQTEGLPFKRELHDPPPMAPSGFFQLAEEMQASSMCHIFSYLYVLENMYDGFYLVDSDLKFRIWNNGMERVLGRSAVRMLDQPWTSKQIEFADKQTRPLDEVSRPLREVIRTEKPLTSQLKVQHDNGNWIDVEVMSVPLFDHDGSLQGVAEIFRNLSEDRRRRREDSDLRRKATRDSLTGLSNRGELERTLRSMFADFNSQSNSEPFSVIFLDVDHFKNVNDTYLHQTGDQVLVNLAKLLQTETYSGELICRYGGEEFVVLCPATDLKQAHAKAERLRVSISQTTLSKVESLKVTVSFGVTEVEDGDTLDDILSRADNALFMSKDKGRNRTTSFTRQQLHGGKSEPVSVPDESNIPYAFDGAFLACVTSEMIGLKFGSFVKEERAKLRKSTEGKATVRIGKTFLLPFWGARQQQQPVELRITFGPPPKHILLPSKQEIAKRTYFEVSITPRGWAPDVATFQARARNVFRSLKSYFAAD